MVDVVLSSEALSLIEWLHPFPAPAREKERERKVVPMRVLIYDKSNVAKFRIV